MVMRAFPLSPLRAAAGRFATCALVHFNLPGGERATALYDAHVVLRDQVPQATGRGAVADVLAVSPHPFHERAAREPSAERSKGGGRIDFPNGEPQAAPETRGNPGWLR
ncbi:hypothetical protein HWE47_02230 [Ralstonia solanacearum]|nr:hypothetical protein HWE47_02230 [Ralstonia solanacearum]